MPKIFISYRRDESTGYAGRLHERLAARYGTGSVFMDMDDIGPGADFAQVIEQTVAACDVFIVLIGSQWLTLKDAAGRRRIDDHADFVRLEISKALHRNVRTIPVLLNNAKMPAPSDLPADIRGLARLQALPLSEERFDYDVGRLADAVGGKSRRRFTRRAFAGAALGLVPVAAIALLWRRPESVDITGEWSAEVPYEFSAPRREVFALERDRDEVRGTASFLGVARGIVEGKIEGDRISFVTRTSEIAGDESRDTRHQYSGTISDDGIHFIMQTSGGFSDHPPLRFTARRTAAPR